MNIGNFSHVTTFWIFMHIKTELISKHRKQFNDKLAVDYFISQDSLCENRQKQQKEAFYLFRLETLPKSILNC